MSHENTEKPSVNEQIWEIALRFYDPGQISLLEKSSAPFDISKPNIHNSKAEFELEKSNVEHAIECADFLQGLILAVVQEDDVEKHAMAKRVKKFVDAAAQKQNFPKRSDSVHLSLRKTASHEGLNLSLIYILDDYVSHLRELHEILVQQEIDFWSDSHRPPNHHARIIALRFARLIARKTRKKPTFGTARDGNHPSTDFGRAIEEIFELLEIQGDFKRATRWAISELKDSDYENPEKTVRNLLAPFAMAPNTLGEYAGLLTKRKGSD